MTWFRVDDDHNDHPKLERLEELCAGDGMLYFAARGVWEAMGVDCSKWETDGEITATKRAKVLRQLTPEQRDRITRLLVECRLWEGAGPWQFHDWADYQPTAAQLRRERKGRAARQRKWRNGDRGASRNSSRNASTQPSTDTSRNGATNSVADASLARARPVPSRPDPIPPNPPQAGGAHFRSTEIPNPLTADELERRKQAARDAIAKLEAEERHG